MFDPSRLSRKWTPARVLSEPCQDEWRWALSVGVENRLIPFPAADVVVRPKNMSVTRFRGTIFDFFSRWNWGCGLAIDDVR
jgi:hypothetical protein